MIFAITPTIITFLSARCRYQVTAYSALLPMWLKINMILGHLDLIFCLLTKAKDYFLNPDCVTSTQRFANLITAILWIKKDEFFSVKLYVNMQ